MTAACPFIWYDVMVKDLTAATAFYGEVVGWQIVDAGMPGMKYSILKANGIDVGGMMEMPADAAARSAPSLWTGYIYVPDVDKAVKAVTRKGGSICQPPQDIPGVGRFAVVMDPHGAVFQLFTPGSSEGQAEVAPGTPGHIGWRELHAGDGPEAWKFYSSLYGWTKGDALDMGDLGVYQLFSTGGPDNAGGMMTKMADTPDALWLYYFNVEAIDAAVARVAAAGGKVVMGPHEVPGGQWVIQGFDNQGIMFALVAPRR
jgi:predicted enzyme related to lactoylglutathione lyase